MTSVPPRRPHRMPATTRSAALAAGILLLSALLTGCDGDSEDPGAGTETEAAAAEETPTTTPTPTAEPSPSAEPEPTGEPSLRDALAAGQVVRCTYTHRGYDAVATLRSIDEWRLDQQMQGGEAHVLRDPRWTLVWIDGMTKADRFASEDYAAKPAAMYPHFDPEVFLAADVEQGDVCEVVAGVPDSMFELPADMSVRSTP